MMVKKSHGSSRTDLTLSRTRSENRQLIIQSNQPCPPGLTNLGNTCYINATLQCLFAIHPLVDWLINRSNMNVLEYSQSSSDSLTLALSRLCLAIFKRNFKSELEDFRRVIGTLDNQFKEAREQDAQEFLFFLLHRLHDETSGRSGTSEVWKIFQGVLQKQFKCPDCHKTLSNYNSSKLGPFSNSSSNRAPPQENPENFLFLSLPIPISIEEMAAATDSVENTNVSELKIVFNQIREMKPPQCYRHLLCLDPNTDIQNVYNLIFSMSQIGLNATNSTSRKGSYATAVASNYHDQKKTSISSLHNDPQPLPARHHDPFLLVQAKSTGFGDWFLDPSGRAIDLVDGLNLEDEVHTNTPSARESVKKNLLVDDGLFIVHLNNHPQEDFDSCFNSSSPLIDQIHPNDDRFYQPCSTTAQNVEGYIQLLLVHVTESKQKNASCDSFDGTNAARVAGFQRFSPPLTLNVPKEIDFESLRLLALRSLLAFSKNDTEAHFERVFDSKAFVNVYFWVVDAGPWEPCEILSNQEFPLLHSTVEVSSIPLPRWLCSTASGAPRLLRLLVVWPQQPIDLLPTFQVTVASGSETPTLSSTTTTATSSANNGRHAKPQNTDKPDVASDSKLTIQKCLKAFVEKELVARAQPFRCPHCHKKQNSALRETTLLQPPDYLLLHLCLFVQVPLIHEHQDKATGGSRLMKINSLVDYPIENLDLSFMLESSKSSRVRLFRRNSSRKPEWQSGGLMYDLVAVCIHKGPVETGHNTAYCKNLFTGQWWHYNDLKVQKVPSDQVIQPGAYILFYKRQDVAVENRDLIAKLTEIVNTSADSESPSMEQA
uniref:ubiquitinyl hydrolase 1 n=1 Tax=Mesocestoides corti TaxID=53468 RepID=A0A5K3F155_MESCO